MSNELLERRSLGFEMIRRIRLDAEKGKVDWDYTKEKTKEYYQFIADFNNPNSVMVHPEYTSWESFQNL